MLAPRQGNPSGGRIQIICFITIVLSVLSACASRSSNTTNTAGGTTEPSAAALPPDAIPWMRSTEDAVDAQLLASDALHPEELATLLQQAGFRLGAERIFTARRGPFSRVEARSLAFGTSAGAAAYLSWLRGHASELIGDTEAVSAPRLPVGVVFVRHLATGCCHEEVPVYLAAWQRGPLVLSVKASGRAADVSPVAAIVRSVDREV
jgi:hypothetical protein